MIDLTGRVFSSYQIIRELGHGGMSVVYLARQRTMDRLVAVKVISASGTNAEDFRARFDQEARIIARLQHPHILPVIDYGEEEFGAYLVMRYVENGTLETRLKQGPLSLELARSMLERIAAALDHAHRQDVIHRDLKPANILLDETDNPYLTDFGIAKLLQNTQHLTETGAAVGTPAYMAPEQWKGEPVGPFTDQYSLGVVLYEMVTGDLPFYADTTYGYMHQHIYEPPPPLRQIALAAPAAAEAVLARALAKNPADRFPSVRALSDAFGAALSGPSPELFVTRPAVDETATRLRAVPAMTEIQPLEAAAPPSQRRSRRGLWVLFAVLAVAIVLAGVLLTASGLFPAKPSATPTTRLIVASAPTLTEPPAAAEAVEEEPGAAMATAALLPTRTPQPTITPFGKLASCEGMLPSRIGVGRLAVVSDNDPRPINVRREPGLNSTRTDQFEVGTEFSVMEGPVCQDGHPWYMVQRRSDGHVGWIAESGEGVYYVVPLDAGLMAGRTCPEVMVPRLVAGEMAAVNTPSGQALRFHADPGSETPVTMLVAQDTVLKVLAGPLCRDGYSWWRFELPDGRIGWASEADNDSYFVTPR